MADLATALVRAPDRVARELAALPGIDAVEARVTGIGLISVPGVVEPVSARLVSLPAGRRPLVNDLVLRAGAWPDAQRSDEVLVNEAFAEAHGLQPGAPLDVLLRGKRRVLRIVGIASSPEFVFAVAPGDILPEPRRFGVPARGRARCPRTSTGCSRRTAAAVPTGATACSRRAISRTSSRSCAPWRASCRRSSCWSRCSCST
jgi:putative ABC transport system permease protein